MWSEHFTNMLVLMVMAALVRMSFELSRQRSSGVELGTHKAPVGGSNPSAASDVPPERVTRDYWDTYLEDNALRAGRKDTDAGAFLSTMIEAAGDILREMGKEDSDAAYMMGKVGKIRRALKWTRDWTDPLSPGEGERLAEVKERVEGLPAPTAGTRAVKELLVAITNRNVPVVRAKLDVVSELVKGSPTPKQREWSEKAVQKYAEAQDKKWRHWNEAMFEGTE